MKHLKGLLLSLVGLMLLFVVFLPIKAEAATWKQITPGTGIALTNYNSGTYYYKLSLKEDSFVKVHWNGNADFDYYGYVYKDSNFTKSLGSIYANTATGDRYIALKRGTYYVKMYDGFSKTPTVRVSFNVTTSASLDKGNYCASKAASLKASTKVTVAQTPNYNYTRWYKVKLTKNQKLTIYSSEGNCHFFSVISAESFEEYSTTSNFSIRRSF